MDHEAVVDQIVRSLSFEVVAIPHDVIEAEYPSNSTPLNVKIRVRKKGAAGFPEGVLSMSKVDRKEYVPGRVRLVSSDQTIMSFNVVMESDDDTKRQNLSLMQPGSKYVPDIATSSGIQSDGLTKNRFTLNKKHKLQTSLVLSKRNKDIFGRCKPGGCLDPPFGEEKYSYKPASQVINTVPNSVDCNKIKTSSIFKNTLFKRKKKGSQDEDNSKDDTSSVNKIDTVNLHQTESIETSNTYSTSIITYPHTSDSTDLHNQEARHSKVRYSSENSSSTASYFIVPKKIKNYSEENDKKLLNDCIIHDQEQKFVVDINDTLRHKSTSLKTASESNISENKNNIAPLLIPLPLLATFDETVRNEDESKSQQTYEIVAQDLVSEILTDKNDSIPRLVLPAKISLTLEDEVQDPVMEKINNNVVLTQELLISKQFDEVTCKETVDKDKEIDQTDKIQSNLSPTISVDDANITDSKENLLPSTLYENNIKENKSSIDIFTDSNFIYHSELENIVSENINNNGKETFHDNVEKSAFTDMAILFQQAKKDRKLIYQNNESNEIPMQLSGTDLQDISILETSLKSDGYTINSCVINITSREYAQSLYEDNQMKLLEKNSDNRIEAYEQEKAGGNLSQDAINQNGSQNESEPEIPMNDVSEKLDNTNVNLMDDIEKLTHPAIKEYISNSYDNNKDHKGSSASLNTSDEGAKTRNDNSIFDDQFQVNTSNTFTEDLNYQIGSSVNEYLNTDDANSRNYHDISVDSNSVPNITILSGTGETEIANHFQHTEGEDNLNFTANEKDNNQLIYAFIAEPDKENLETENGSEQVPSIHMSENFDKQSIIRLVISSALKPSFELLKNMTDSDLVDQTIPTSSILRKDAGVWRVDLALHSYTNENNELVIKSFDSENVPEHNEPNQTKALIVAKCLLGSNSNEIKIPIDNENQLSIQIKNNRFNQSLTDISITADDSLRKTEIRIEVPGGDVDNRDYDDVNKSEANKHNNIMSNDNERDALISIYEQELVPLQTLIKGLREEIDLLTSYRMMLKEKCTPKRIKPSRLMYGNRKCGCSRRL